MVPLTRVPFWYRFFEPQPFDTLARIQTWPQPHCPAELIGPPPPKGLELNQLDSSRGVVPGSSFPLKLQALGKLIFYRYIAHVTQQVEKLCF